MLVSTGSANGPDAVVERQPLLLVADVVGDDGAPGLGEQTHERVGGHGVAVDDRAGGSPGLGPGDLYEADGAVGRLPLGRRADRAAVGLDVDRHDRGPPHALADGGERRAIGDQREGRVLVQQWAVGGGERREPPMRRRLDEVGRRLGALARGVDERHLEAAVGGHLDAAADAALGERLTHRREPRGVVERVDQLGVEAGQRRQAPEQPEPVAALGPQAQLGVGTGGRAVDHAHGRRPERRAAAARAALAHELAVVRHAGEQRRHALEQRKRREHARVERVGRSGNVLHRPENTDRVGRYPSRS